MSVYLYVFISLGIVVVLSLIFLLLIGKSRKRRLIASKFTECMTIAIGISTIISTIISIYIMMRQDKIQQYIVEMQEMEHQPTFLVRYDYSKTENSDVYDVQDFVIENIGTQMSTPADIDVKTVINVEFIDYINDLKCSFDYPLSYYYNAVIKHDELTGVLIRTVGGEFIQNNLKFHKIYKDALDYSIKNDKIYLSVDKVDYFKIRYTDIYGKNRIVCYRNNRRISTDIYEKIVDDFNGTLNPISINEISFKEIIATIHDKVEIDFNNI